jgi:hypothetical protein
MTPTVISAPPRREEKLCIAGILAGILAFFHRLDCVVVAAVATNQLAALRSISLVIAVALAAGVERRMELAVLVTRENEAQAFTFLIVIAEEANRRTLSAKAEFQGARAANLDTTRICRGDAKRRQDRHGSTTDQHPGDLRPRHRHRFSHNRDWPQSTEFWTFLPWLTAYGRPARSIAGHGLFRQPFSRRQADIHDVVNRRDREHRRPTRDSQYRATGPSASP